MTEVRTATGRYLISRREYVSNVLTGRRDGWYSRWGVVRRKRVEGSVTRKAACGGIARQGDDDLTVSSLTAKLHLGRLLRLLIHREGQYPKAIRSYRPYTRSSLEDIDHSMEPNAITTAT